MYDVYMIPRREFPPFTSKDRQVNATQLKGRLVNIRLRGIDHAKEIAKLSDPSQVGMLGTEADSRIKQLRREHEGLVNSLIYDLLVARKENRPLPKGLRISYKASEGDTFHPYSQNEIYLQLPFFYTPKGNEIVIVSDEERQQMIEEAKTRAITGGRRFQMPQFEQMNPLTTHLSLLARYHQEDTGIYNPVGTFSTLIDVHRDKRVEEMPDARARRKMREIKIIDGRISRQWAVSGRDTLNEEVQFLHELKLPLLVDLVQARVDAEATGNNDYVFITRQEDKPDQWIRVSVPFRSDRLVHTQINLGDTTLMKVVQKNPELLAAYTKLKQLLGNKEFDGSHQPPFRPDEG